MDGNTFILVIISGLCILPSSFPHRYHIVKEAMTWTKAQSYCREKYTDLVTINSEEDMVRLSHMIWGAEEEFWTGLYGDYNNWIWSLERKGFYEEGETEFRLWSTHEPNDLTGLFVCVDINPYGGWSDHTCDAKRPFVCYNEFSENRYVYVTTPMNWTDAQSYCRSNYTDLASVRNATENEEIRNLVQTYSWIGLYRWPWKWSDGQLMHRTSFSDWTERQPYHIQKSCVTTTYSKLNARLCDSKYPFICSESVRMQVVKVMLTKSDSVDLEEMQDAILQQFNQRLKKHGLGEQVKLTWLRQPDGKIFHLKETKEKEEGCGKKRHP